MSVNPNNPALPSLIDNITQNLFQHFANNPQLINQVLSTIFHRQHQQQCGQQQQNGQQQQQQPSSAPETSNPTDESPIEIDKDDVPATAPCVIVESFIRPAENSADKSHGEEEVGVETDFVCA